MMTLYTSLFLSKDISTQYYPTLTAAFHAGLGFFCFRLS